MLHTSSFISEVIRISSKGMKYKNDFQVYFTYKLVLQESPGKGSFVLWFDCFSVQQNAHTRRNLKSKENHQE